MLLGSRINNKDVKSIQLMIANNIGYQWMAFKFYLTKVARDTMYGKVNGGACPYIDGQQVFMGQNRLLVSFQFNIVT